MVAALLDRLGVAPGLYQQGDHAVIRTVAMARRHGQRARQRDGGLRAGAQLSRRSGMRLLQQCSRLVVLAQADVGPSQCFEQPRLHRRLPGKPASGLAHAGVDQVQRGRRAAQRDFGVGRLEHADQEVAHRIGGKRLRGGARRLRFGPLLLLSRLMRLPQRSGHPAQQAEQQRRRHADTDAMALQVAAHAIERGWRARGDRAPFARRGDVGQQCVHRAVARGRGLGQRLVHDGVQVGQQRLRCAAHHFPGRARRGGPGRLVAHPGDHRAQRQPLQRQWRAPAQQEVQHRAKRVDVRTHAGAVVDDQLRRGEFRRQRYLGRRGVRIGVARQHPGDAEIEQVRVRPGVDEDIARLDVTVDDQALMRIGHGRGDLPEKRQACVETGPGMGEPGIERAAVDMLGDQVGMAVGERAGIEQAHDARVLQPGEHAPLGLDVARQRRAVAADELDGDLPVEQPVGALAQPDLAHATAPDQAQSPPVARDLAFVADRVGRGFRHQIIGRPFDAGQPATQRRRIRGIAARHFGNEGGACAFRQVQQAIEQGLTAPPVVGRGFAHASGCSRSYSQPRAFSQSRRTVLRSMSSTSPVSSSLRPAK